MFKSILNQVFLLMFINIFFKFSLIHVVLIV